MPNNLPICSLRMLIRHIALAVALALPAVLPAQDAFTPREPTLLHGTWPTGDQKPISAGVITAPPGDLTYERTIIGDSTTVTKTATWFLTHHWPPDDSQFYVLESPIPNHDWSNP